MPNIDMLSYRKRSTPKKNYNARPRPATVSRIVMEERIDRLRKVDFELIYRLRMYEQIIAAAEENARELNNQLASLSNLTKLAQELFTNGLYGVKNTVIRAGYHFGMASAKIACTPVVIIPYLGPKLWEGVEYITSTLKEQLIKHTGEYKTLMPSVENKAFESVYRVAYERYLMDTGAYGNMSKFLKIAPQTIQNRVRSGATSTMSSPQQERAQEAIDKTKDYILSFLRPILPVHLDKLGIDLKEGYKTAKDGALAASYAKSSQTLGGALPTDLLQELLATYDEYESCLNHLFEMARLYSEKLSQSLTDGYYQRIHFDVDFIYAYVPQFALAKVSIQSIRPVVDSLKELLKTYNELIKKNIQREIQLKQDERLEKIERQAYIDRQNQPYGSEWEANNGKSRWGATRSYLQLRQR